MLSSSALSARERDLSPQWGLKVSRDRNEEARRADAERIVGVRLDVPPQPPKNAGSSWVRRCQPRDDAQTAAAAALERPEQFRIAAGVGDAHLAVGGDDLGLQQAGRRRAEALREAAEAAALNQSRDADVGAAAALDIAAALVVTAS